MAVESEAAALRTRTRLAVAMLRCAPTLGDERTLLARLLAPAAVPAVLGHDPLLQLLDVDDLVETVRAVAHGRHDGAFNVAGEGVLPLSTVIKLSGRLRAPAVEPVLRLALQSLWVVGAGLVPGAHAGYLRETFVADTARMHDVLELRARYSIRDALARHRGGRRGGFRVAA